MAKPVSNPERLAPRLRMIVNGDDEVNTYRSVLSASVTAPKVAVRQVRPLERLQRASRSAAGKAAEPMEESYRRRVRVSCFVQLEDADSLPEELPAASRTGLARGPESSAAPSWSPI